VSSGKPGPFIRPGTFVAGLGQGLDVVTSIELAPVPAAGSTNVTGCARVSAPAVRVLPLLRTWWLTPTSPQPAGSLVPW
jgi:hypothetical protein